MEETGPALISNLTGTVVLPSFSLFPTGNGDRLCTGTVTVCKTTNEVLCQQHDPAHFDLLVVSVSRIVLSNTGTILKQIEGTTVTGVPLVHEIADNLFYSTILYCVSRN